MTLQRRDFLAMLGRGLFSGQGVVFPFQVADDIRIASAEVDGERLAAAVQVLVPSPDWGQAPTTGSDWVRAEVVIQLDRLWSALTLVDDRGVRWRSYGRGRAWTDGAGRWWGLEQDGRAAAWSFPVGVADEPL